MRGMAPGENKFPQGRPAQTEIFTARSLRAQRQTENLTQRRQAAKIEEEANLSRRQQRGQTYRFFAQIVSKMPPKER
jgi:hypothetical protein